MGKIQKMKILSESSNKYTKYYKYNTNREKFNKLMIINSSIK